jgi:hypothetical protein
MLSTQERQDSAMSVNAASCFFMLLAKMERCLDAKVSLTSQHEMDAGGANGSRSWSEWAGRGTTETPVDSQEQGAHGHRFVICCDQAVVWSHGTGCERAQMRTVWWSSRAHNHVKSILGLPKYSRVSSRPNNGQPWKSMSTTANGV